MFVVAWHPHTTYLLATGLIPLYVFFARIPRIYYRVLVSPESSSEDLAAIGTWPRNTLSVMDWFSEIINWLFILAAIFLFAALFIPGILFSDPTS